MIILSLLSLLFNFSASTTHTDISCNQLIEVISNQDNGDMTYCNRYKLPAVDSNGKMLFYMGLQRTGSINILSMKPAMSCDIAKGAEVVITFTDKTVFEVLSHSNGSNVEINIDDELRAQMMTKKILSIAFDGKKYPYNVVLKPNQGRAVQDVMNCLQN